ncbi:hypothetical protein Tco_1416091 [Tanacetum coccineum]
MEVKSFEEGLLTKVEEMVKWLQSTFLLHQSKLKESLRQARQDFTLASEKFQRSIEAAIKEDINQEGHVDFLGVQLNQRIPNRKVKVRLFSNKFVVASVQTRKLGLLHALEAHKRDTTKNMGSRNHVRQDYGATP